MFENIKQEKFLENMNEIKKKNQRFQYLIELAKEYYPQLKEIFAQKETEQTKLEEKILEGLQQTIQSLKKYQDQDSTYNQEDLLAPPILLGLVGKQTLEKDLFKNINEKNGIYKLAPTSKGKQILKDLEEIEKD